MAAVAIAGCAVDTSQDSGSGVKSGQATAPTSTAKPVPATTDTIPLTLVNGVMPVVKVSVGGGPEVPVQLDTGSAGLRVLREAVGPEATAMASSADDNITFVDGTTYRNELASATVRIAGVIVPQPVTVAVVEDITCEPDATACTPGTAAAKADGQYGILGIDLDIVGGRVPSPLLSMPQWRSFSVAYRDDGTGVLSSGVPAGGAVESWPLAAADSGLPGVQGWAQDFTACWRLASRGPACVPTTFDTGATDVVVPPDLAGGVSPGDALVASDGTLSLEAATGSGSVWTLVPGNTAQDSVYVGAAGNSGYDGVLAGTPIFYAFDVGVDQNAGRIALYPRSLAP